MERFSETSLKDQISGLPSWKQIAFILLCCERMIPNYVAFSKEVGFGNALLLRRALASAWKWVESGQLPKDLHALREACDQETPNTEDYQSVFTSAALDAANAIAIALEAIETPSASLAVEVAGLSRDTVDMFVQSARSLDPADSTFEYTVAADPLMQTELRRQREDLNLLKASGNDRRAVASSLRDKSLNLYGLGSLLS